jgi:hypothetical protein
MKPAAEPRAGWAAAVDRPARQTEIAAHNQSGLAVCKARLDGLQSFIRTERGLLVGPAPEGNR